MSKLTPNIGAKTLTHMILAKTEPALDSVLFRVLFNAIPNKIPKTIAKIKNKTAKNNIAC
jgi:hypothetical protein